MVCNLVKTNLGMTKEEIIYDLVKSLNSDVASGYCSTEEVIKKARKQYAQLVDIGVIVETDNKSRVVEH